MLGSYPESQLPPEATGSMEVDTAFFSDPEETKSDIVDVNIGELSDFHNEFGYYPQGVSIETAVLPAGWQNRLAIYVSLRSRARSRSSRRQGRAAAGG